MGTLRIPGYDMSTNQGNAPLPQAQPVSQSGTISAGNVLLGISQEIQEAYDVESFTGAQVKYLHGVSALKEKYAASQDFEQNPALFSEDMRALRESILEPLNQRVGAKIGPWMDLESIDAEERFKADNQ